MLVRASTTARASSGALIQGLVALYAKDGRWRRAVAASLEGSGHSHDEASSAAELHRLLASRRFDLLALKVRDVNEARELAAVLEGIRMPLHTILVGSIGALPVLPRRRTGTFRFVPGRLEAQELARLVDVSITAGAWDDAADESTSAYELEEVDLEEAIERAAEVVYRDASRKRQRFHSAVVGPDTRALADKVRLRHTLISLLRLTVSLAPYRSLISVEAQASKNDWLIRITAGKSGWSLAKTGQVTEALRQETKTLDAISRAVAGQGGMLWVELVGSAGVAFSMTLPLPLPAECTQSRSGEVTAGGRWSPAVAGRR